VDAAITAIRSHVAKAKVDGIVADFSGSAGAEAVIAELPAVDVLVNNVDMFEPKPFAEIPDSDNHSNSFQVASRQTLPCRITSGLPVSRPQISAQR
jgi:hypothetical protein